MRRIRRAVFPTFLLIACTVSTTAQVWGKELLAAHQLSSHSQAHILRSGLAALMQGPTSGPVSYVYDELGRLIAAIDSAGNAAAYNYDAVGNILSITRYTVGQISLFSFSPKQGPSGTAVTLYGTGFSTTPTQNSVQFNGVAATVVSASANQMVVQVPAGTTSGPISVTSPAGSVTSTTSFLVTGSSVGPRIDSFTPQVATAGTSVTATGANFALTPQNNRVRINSTPAGLPSNVTTTSFNVTVPGQTGSGHISLGTPAGTATSSGDLFIPPSGYSASQVAFTGRANIGSTTTVSVGVSGGVGLLIFDGVAGHSVSLSTSAPAFNGACTLQLYNPDYTPLGSSASCSAATFVDSQKLPTTGTHTVLITPSSGVTGSVAVTVRDSTDFITSVVPNGAGVTLNINSAGQNARATFPGVAGQQATAQFTSNNLGSVTASLLNPDGSTLTSITSSSASFSLPTVMLPSSGEYTILVDAASASTGSVVLSVIVAGGTHAVPRRSSGSLVDPSNALSQNLVGLFVMNEGSGTTDRNLVDNQLANFSGTVLPMWNTFDPSINFQGGASLASYLDAGTDLAFDQLTPNKMTVVAKVFLNSVVAGGFAEKNDGNASTGFALGVDNTGALVFNVVKFQNMRVATAANTVTSGQWMQIAFTWDGTVNTAAAAHIYVNGIEQTKVSSIDGSPGAITNANNATNKPFRIGNASFDTDSGSLNGKIAYLAVYKYRILTPVELNNLDTQLQIATDVVASTNENGGPVTVTTNSAGQNAHVTFNGWAQQQVIVQLSNNTMGSVNASLIAPDGSAVTSTASSSGNFTLPTATLPTTGTYDVFIHPTGATTGSITVNLAIQTGGRAVGSVADPSNSLSQNLVGLFVMNEGSGTTDKNLVDNQLANFSGTVLPMWNTFDPSINFQSGASLASYLDAGTDLAFDQLTPNKMTVVAKVFLNSVVAGGIAEKNDGNVSTGFAFGLDNTGALVFDVVKFQNMRVATAANTVTSGQWMQVAFTWDGTVNTAAAAHIYVNGIEQTKVSSADGAPGAITNANNATNKPFRIGNASFDTDSGSLNGKIAYLAVYRGRILTTTELNQLDSQLPIDALDVSGTVTPNAPSTPVTISSAGQNGRFFFSATGGQNATIQLTNNTLGSVTVSLLNLDGTTLATITSSASSFAVAPTLIPVTGTYPIYIHPNGASSGTISVAVNLISTPSRPAGAVLDLSNPLSTNLTGLFVMNEGSGTTDLNLANAQTAAFSGTSVPTWNTADPSVLFNGGGSLNSYLDAGTDLAFDQLPTSKVTILAKVYVNTVAAAGICEKNDVNQLAGFLFGWDSTGAIHLEVEESQTNMHVISGSSLVTSGQWIQVAFTWDGTINATSAAHLFLNGAEQNKVSSTSPGGTLTYANATNKPFRIGNAGFHAIAGSLNGKMAYLAVYRGRILTTAEMSQLDAQLPIH